MKRCTDDHGCGEAPCVCRPEPEDTECPGHPASEYGPMGETEYCDGSCVQARA